MDMKQIIEIPSVKKIECYLVIYVRKVTKDMQHKQMPTESGGSFHIELLICDAVDGIQFVRRVTNDIRVSKIMEHARFKRLGKDLEESRQLGRKRSKISSFEEDEAFAITPATRNGLFDPDSPPSSPPRRGSLFGGKSKKKFNKKKLNKKTRNKRKSKKHRKTYRRKV